MNMPRWTWASLGLGLCIGVYSSGELFRFAVITHPPGQWLELSVIALGGSVNFVLAVLFLIKYMRAES